MAKKKKRRNKKAMQTPYDQSYKRFFSSHDMVESLIRAYVDPALVGGFDFSTLEEFPTNKIGPFGEEHRNDIIYKCKYRGKDTYILLMLEFQSSIDRFMAVRVLAYIACIWLHLSKSLKAGENLPPILPILLYNGTPVWNAPLSFYELLAEMPEELKPYQGMKYFLLDFGRLDKEKIDSDNGVASVLIKMEVARTEKEYTDVMLRLNELHRFEKTKELARMLTLYFATIAKNAEFFNKAVENATTCKEDNMLLDNLKAMKESFIGEGFQQGIEKGIEKGRKEMKIEEDKKRDEGIRNLLCLGKLSVDEIAKSFSLPMEHVLRIQSQLA